MTPELHFFVGKGGVGKSTTSALTGLSLAAAGRKTLLVSMDPAHNQQDIFETEFSEKPRRVCDGLSVKQVDTRRWMARYLKQTREHIRKTYLYQSAFNIQDHFKVLEFSPGLEEYALLMAFEDVVARSGDQDAILFDMAPTALSLRFFALPAITLIWLEKLLSLRMLICEKKEIISRIRIGRREIERDRVKNTLGDMIERHRRLRDLFLSDPARIHLVLNDDRLSLSESIRIRDGLAVQGMAIDRLVVNRADPAGSGGRISRAFGSLPVSRLPAAPVAPIGLAALKQYLAAHPGAFHGFLPHHDLPLGPTLSESLMVAV
ncbi:MAG: ArsA family ATPase [Desulfobacterales bacterium]|nr:ArsA family ATPase [Desulfobacterales bacterium]